MRPVRHCAWIVLPGSNKLPQEPRCALLVRLASTLPVPRLLPACHATLASSNPKLAKAGAPIVISVNNKLPQGLRNALLVMLASTLPVPKLLPACHVMLANIKPKVVKVSALTAPKANRSYIRAPLAVLTAQWALTLTLWV